MKLPSLRQTYKDALITARRFPMVICCAALSTGAALLLVDHEGPSQPTPLFNILLAGILGIPFLFSLTLIGEKRKFSRPLRAGSFGLGILLLAGYGFTIPTDLTHAPQLTWIRFFILAVGLHMFAAFAPFLEKGEQNGFWQYNKGLFLRILTAVLYSLVLYIGLSIALAALEHLFGMSVPWKRYLELWILIAGPVNTWLFLAGIPEDLKELETVSDYPRSLKVLAQYILLPIVTAYLLILYAYLAKIVIQ